MTKQWIKCELHTHTVHSDGNFTLDELAQKASSLYDLDYIALTDHNTITGNYEIGEISQKYDIGIIPSIELTTYYGHIVVLGVEGYVEWRDMGVHDFNMRLHEIAKTSSVVGIAHPFRIGDPISTGSHFEYKSVDWNLVDYIEVWSLQHPTVKYDTKLAFRFWDNLLNQGYKISGVYGRDWHRGGSKDDIKTYNLIGVDKRSQHELLYNIKAGNLMCSYGPLLELSTVMNGVKKSINYGDTLIKDGNTIILEIDWTFNHIHNTINFQEQELELKINSNLGIIKSIIRTQHKNSSQVELDIEDVKWFRLEVSGEIDNEMVMIAFTNPIYL